MRPTIRRDALLKFAIVVVIFTLAGPEIFAAIEMQILLELLGAALFTAAFIAGARLALSQAADFALSLLLPIPHVAVLRGQAQLREKGVAAIYILKNAVWSMGFVLICWQLMKEIARLLY